MKAFVSYATADQEFATSLIASLKLQGIGCWSYKASVAVNVPSIIDQQLRVSDFVLLIWSDAARQSKWVTQEWTAAYHREVDEESLRLIVIIAGNTPLPEILRAKQAIDATLDPRAAVLEAGLWMKQLMLDRIVASLEPQLQWARDQGWRVETSIEESSVFFVHVNAEPLRVLLRFTVHYPQRLPDVWSLDAEDNLRQVSVDSEGASGPDHVRGIIQSLCECNE